MFAAKATGKCTEVSQKGDQEEGKYPPPNLSVLLHIHELKITANHLHCDAENNPLEGLHLEALP